MQSAEKFVDASYAQALCGISLLLSIFCENLINGILKCTEIFVIVNAAHKCFAHDIAVSVNDIRCRERSDTQCKFSGIAVRIKIDVPIFRSLCFQNLFCRRNILLVTVKCTDIYTKYFTALFFDAIIQGCLLYTSPSPRDCS